MKYTECYPGFHSEHDWSEYPPGPMQEKHGRLFCTRCGIAERSARWAPTEVEIPAEVESRLLGIGADILENVTSEIRRLSNLVSGYPIQEKLLRAYAEGYTAGYRKRMEDEESEKSPASVAGPSTPEGTATTG